MAYTPICRTPASSALPVPPLPDKCSNITVQSWLEDANILAEMADATGGTFFHNNNDLEAGFRRLAAVPEFSYLLGFSPQEPEA